MNNPFSGKDVLVPPSCVSWRWVFTIGGGVRIDDVADDAPIATFHQGSYDGQAHAKFILACVAFAASEFKKER